LWAYRSRERQSTPLRGVLRSQAPSGPAGDSRPRSQDGLVTVASPSLPLRGGRRGNNEGGIYQRQSDNRWCASVALDGGKRRVLYDKTREEVATKLTRVLGDLQKGLALPSHQVTSEPFLNSGSQS
jgi:hypothetical protein